MRKALLLFISLFHFISCSSPPDSFLSLSGSISNTNQDSIIVSGKNYIKTINLNDNGSFKDTLIVEKGYYKLRIGEKSTDLFLKNGFDLRITADTDHLISSISFEGKGADNNSFIAEKTAFVSNEIGKPRDYFTLDKQAFDAKVDTLRKKLRAMFEGRQLDSSLVAREKAINRRWIRSLTSNYQQQHELYSGIEKGDPSPTFKNFETYGGRAISFKDLPKEYLYIMVWAVDCKTCVEEIPTWKKIRKEYRDQNIRFVGISVDEKEEQDRWKSVVSQKKPGGIQLHTGNGLYRKFIRDYNITKPPRYILVDPKRNIVDAFAPAPSSPELEKLFEELGI